MVANVRRLEVSCLVRLSKASGMITDVSRLLFQEGVDVVQADTLLDGEYVSMFYELTPTSCGPRSWQALLSKVNDAVFAAGYDVAYPQSCTCQVLARPSHLCCCSRQQIVACV